MTELELLARDKYGGDVGKVTPEDRERINAGEPLAYVIGWLPFLGLHIDLSSKPLIPRPETEWWTGELIKRLRERFGDSPFRVLDLCAGSGATGLSILNTFPNAHVSFGELMPKHVEQIQKNMKLNGLDEARTDVRASDLFTAFPGEQWDIIASNPPYIPETRKVKLEQSVVAHEPHEALFAGEDGLELIRRILHEARGYLSPGGELWLECDISNIEAAKELAEEAGASRTTILTDQYGRPRMLVSYFE